MKHILLPFFILFSLTVLANRQDYFKQKTNPIIQNRIEIDTLKFSIFPNPIKDQRLFIDSNGMGEKHIEIYNVLGEKKFETHTFEEAIFLNNLEKGIYLFYLQQDNQKRYKRLIIH